MLGVLLKGLCHGDIAVFGQFCAEGTTCNFTHTQKAPVELCRSYQANFIRSTNHDSFCDFSGHSTET